jgi:hypothetical protein
MIRIDLNISIRFLERLKNRGWKEELEKLGPKSGPTDRVEEVLKACYCQSELTETGVFSSLVNSLPTIEFDPQPTT